MKKIASDNGEWQEAGDHTERNYNIGNSLSAEDGCTMPELMSIMGPWMAKFEELKNADGL